MVREILTHCGFEVRRTRFVFKNRLYPIQVVIFEGHELGHFIQSYYQIGLNKNLLYLAKDSVIRDILKHEIAHYLTFLNFGSCASHGKEFHSICEQYGFPPEVSKATLNISEANENKEGDIVSEKILDRVKKLLTLAQSSNLHEAELATLKANEILLRHNLSSIPNEQETIYLERFMHQKRKDAKMEAIVEIIKHFIVRPVISYGQETCCLEVSGSLTNVKLASYVIHFLLREMDLLWMEAKNSHKLEGLRAKNSFFYGLAKGFQLKIEASKNQFEVSDKKSLVLVEKDLIKKTQMIYRRLSSATSHSQIDSKAKDVGIERGKNLNIRPGVESQGSTRFLSYKGKL